MQLRVLKGKGNTREGFVRARNSDDRLEWHPSSQRPRWESCQARNGMAWHGTSAVPASVYLWPCLAHRHVVSIYGADQPRTQLNAAAKREGVLLAMLRDTALPCTRRSPVFSARLCCLLWRHRKYMPLGGGAARANMDGVLVCARPA